MSYNQMDSSSCLQRAVCSYVQSVNDRIKSGDVTTMETWLDSTFSLSLLFSPLDRFSFKSLVIIGKKFQRCADAYPKCTLFEDSITSGLKKILLG
ncbi:hypothetical protein WDU94_012530 [Cyamophila willieti]